MRLPRTVPVLLLLAAVMWPAVTAGEGEAGEGSDRFDEEVVVTATRDDVPLDRAPGSVTVITRDEIERSAARTLDDLLRRVPGFSLFRRASSLVAHPTTQGASLRNIAPSGAGRALVLVNGIPVNDAFGGWVHWGRMPLDTIEQIEILEGGASSLWGSQALAGVINIVTRRTPEKKDLSIGVEAGNQRVRAASVRAGMFYKKLGWSLEANLFDGDGYEIVREKQRGPIDIAAFSEELNFKGGIERRGKKARFFVEGAWSNEERGNGTPLTNNGTVARALTGRSNWGGNGAGDWEARLFIRDQTFDSTFSAQDPNRLSENPALDQFAVDSTDVGASLQWSRGIGSSHHLTAGSDLRFVDGQTSERFFWSGVEFLRLREAGGEQTFAGFFAQDRFTVNRDLLLNFAVRAEVWIDADGFRRETEIATQSLLRDQLFDDRTEFGLSPRVDLLWRVTRPLSVRGSVYQSFRAPTINELYRPFRVRNDITEANAGLDPETLTGAEAGFDLGGGRVRGRMTLFWNVIDDAVANVTIGEATTAMTIPPCGFVPAGGSCRQRLNVEEVTVIGVEAGIDYRPAKGWKFTLDYIHTDATVTEAKARRELEGNRLAQTPEQQATLGVTWDRAGALGARIEGRYVGDQYEDDLEQRRMDDFVVADLSVWGRIGGSTGLYVGVENLFDREYEVGISGTGLVTIGMPRRVHVGVNVSLHGGGS